jgi:hypothetical protein
LIANAAAKRWIRVPANAQARGTLEFRRKYKTADVRRLIIGQVQELLRRALHCRNKKCGTG